MPREAWSQKRERQYEHIKEGLVERDRSVDTAKEIAARTVNKERARTGEAQTGRGTNRQPDLHGRHLLGTARRPAVPQGKRRANLRPALQRSPPARREGSLPDEQAGARTRAQSLSLSNSNHTFVTSPPSTPQALERRSTR